jgi:hypothetical protein
MGDLAALAGHVLRGIAMTHELCRILADKRTHRELLAALPITQRLYMLEVLRGGCLEIAIAREGQRDEARPMSTPTS